MLSWILSSDNKSLFVSVGFILIYHVNTFCKQHSTSETNIIIVRSLHIT